MELTVKQENLSKALNIISSIASGRSNLPILSNVLIRDNGNRLLVASTNLEIAVSQSIGARIEKTGSITVPMKIFSNFISQLPKGNISLKVEGNHLFIESGNYKSKINCTSADDFPELPSVDEENSKKISISASKLKEAISQTIFTVSTDTARPVLTGVYWHTVDGKLFLASTDGYRLSEKMLCETNEEISAIIPSSTLKKVYSDISDGDEVVDILFDDSQVEFKIGDVNIVSLLTDGNYLDYRRLIPASTENNIKVSKNDFSRIVKVASIFSTDSGGSVTLETNEENQTVSINSIASELGENTSEAQAEISGSASITLNSRYILSALSNIDGENVLFGFSGKIAPTILKSENKDDYIHIIMPLKS